MRSIFSTEPVCKTEAKPPIRVINRFAISSEPKKQVLSRYAVLNFSTFSVNFFGIGSLPEKNQKRQRELMKSWKMRDFVQELLHLRN